MQCVNILFSYIQKFDSMYVCMRVLDPVELKLDNDNNCRDISLTPI